MFSPPPPPTLPSSPPLPPSSALRRGRLVCARAIYVLYIRLNIAQWFFSYTAPRTANPVRSVEMDDSRWCYSPLKCKRLFNCNFFNIVYQTDVFILIFIITISSCTAHDVNHNIFISIYQVKFIIRFYSFIFTLFTLFSRWFQIENVEEINNVMINI